MIGVRAKVDDHLVNLCGIVVRTFFREPFPLFITRCLVAGRDGGHRTYGQVDGGEGALALDGPYPRVQSLPVPDSSTQMARSCWSWANDLKKKSMGMIPETSSR
jgi:hypothetical protein